MNYGFRFFDTVSPHKAGDEIMIERIWMGDKEQVKLGVAETSYVTLSRNNVKKMTASVEMTGQLEAPIEKDNKWVKSFTRLMVKMLPHNRLLLLKQLTKVVSLARSSIW